MVVKKILLSGMGAGYIHPAPGTWGSLLGLLYFFLLSQILYGFWLGILSIVLMTISAIIVIDNIESEGDFIHDPDWIVLDEIVGIGIAVLPLLFLGDTNWYWWGGAFFVFRILDIWKPGPIGYIDRHITGGVGVMGDDILAGGFITFFFIAFLCIR